MGPSAVLCQLQGFSLQFCYTSAVFWLSSMSRLMWKNFSRIRGFNALQQQYKYGFLDRKYKYYALYSFGCPMLLTSVTILMQYLPEHLVEGFITPRIGVHSCFIDETGDGFKIPLLWYFHIINAPILFINLAFFVAFLWNMVCGIWAQTPPTGSVASQSKRKVKAVCKVFFVMGLTWIAEIITWILKITYGHHRIYKFIFPLEVLNASQGVIMFCVVYFTRDQIQSLKSGFRSKPSVT